MSIHRESTGRFVLFRFTSIEACFRAQQAAVDMLDFLGYSGALFIERRVWELSILRAVVRVPQELPRIAAMLEDTEPGAQALPEAIWEALVSLVQTHQEAATHEH